MENLIIKGTEQTPEINFNKNGLLSIKGISIPENITDFYIPIIDWMNEFEKELPSTIQLIFEIEYINTSSTRVFIDIIKKVNAYKELCPNTIISWKYESDDEDNYDLGRDLEYSTKAVFSFEPLS